MARKSKPQEQRTEISFWQKENENGRKSLNRGKPRNAHKKCNESIKPMRIWRQNNNNNNNHTKTHSMKLTAIIKTPITWPKTNKEEIQSLKESCLDRAWEWFFDDQNNKYFVEKRGLFSFWFCFWLNKREKFFV